MRMQEGARYAVFRRSDGGWWQFIAGGGEDGEAPVDAARRETLEEAGIRPDSAFFSLDSLATVPVPGVTGGPMQWGENVLVIPEHCFGVEVEREALALSAEHTEYRWASHDGARELLRWDSNRNALWELDHRIWTRRLREVER